MTTNRVPRSVSTRDFRFLPQALAVLTATGLASCTNKAPSAMDPQGPVAATIADLWWLMLFLATLAFVVVMVFLWYGFLRRPLPPSEEDKGPFELKTWAALVGVGVTAIVLASLMVIDLKASEDLTAPPTTPTVAFQVVGHMWWWEVRYPDADVATANEIHIPVGQPVEVHVNSADVIHSFWVPQLQGKVDMIPGHLNSMWFQADNPGIYRGQCAEYCGAQHAHMAFHVVAEPADQFQAWLADQSAPATQPTDPVAKLGMDLFLSSGCTTCHTVRGTDARGLIGPDLTHVGSRKYIAAGTLENTRENIARWITNTQLIKPGNKMPNFGLQPGSDFVDAVSAYLESLK